MLKKKSRRDEKKPASHADDAGSPSLSVRSRLVSSGPCWNPWCQRFRQRWPITFMSDARSSMPSCTCCAAAISGACCPTSFQRGEPSTVTFREGIWNQILHTLRMLVRLKQGRDPEPSAAIIDSQSIKASTVCSPEKGYDKEKMWGANATSWWILRAISWPPG